MNKFRIACTAAAWAALFALPAAADEYDQYYVRVSIDQIKAGYQRGKSPITIT